jgi:hypothetical protein
VTVKVTAGKDAAPPSSSTSTSMAGRAAVALMAAAAAVLGATTAVLHTTQHHPFWNRTTSEWVNAAELKPGDQLKTDDGATAEVVAVHNFAGEQDMRDLTVADTHTYYVIASGATALVPMSGASYRTGRPATLPPEP